MGNEQTNKKSTDVEVQLDHSKINVLKVTNDPKNNNQRIMQATFSAEQQDYNAWKENLLQAKPNKEYLLLPLSHDFTSKALCGTTGSVTVNYENYPYLLIEEISNRLGKKKRFDETELWLLLFCLIQAKKQMRNGNNSRVGDIRPQNIFINQNGSIKLANLLSWPKESNNYEKFLENQITFLAPEDMKFIETSSLDNDSNKLSEIFSIGLTILSAANLVDYSNLYGTKDVKFKIDQFNHVIAQWRENDIYSDIFRATILSFLEIDQEHRITEYQIEPWIQKYSNEILAQQDFVINDPPKKIIDQVSRLNRGQEQHQVRRQISVNSQYFNSIHGSDQKRIGGSHVLEGSRRLVDQKILPAVSSIPGTNTVQSIYTPIGGTSTYTSHLLLQGAPIGSNFNPSFINRNIEKTQTRDSQQYGSKKQQIGESSGSYSNSWLAQGATLQNSNYSYVPKTKFEYRSSSPEKINNPSNEENQARESPEKEQNKNQVKHQQNSQSQQKKLSENQEDSKKDNYQNDEQ